MGVWGLDKFLLCDHLMCLFVDGRYSRTQKPYTTGIVTSGNLPITMEEKEESKTSPTPPRPPRPPRLPSDLPLPALALLALKEVIRGYWLEATSLGLVSTLSVGARQAANERRHWRLIVRAMFPQHPFEVMNPCHHNIPSSA